MSMFALFLFSSRWKCVALHSPLNLAKSKCRIGCDGWEKSMFVKSVLCKNRFKKGWKIGNWTIKSADNEGINFKIKHSRRKVFSLTVGALSPVFHSVHCLAVLEVGIGALLWKLKFKSLKLADLLRFTCFPLSSFSINFSFEHHLAVFYRKVFYIFNFCVFCTSLFGPNCESILFFDYGIGDKEFSSLSLFYCFT